MHAIADTIALLLAIMPALCGGERAASRADQVIGECKNATRNVTAVHANVEVIEYDESFKCIRYGHGSFGYFQPRVGFWQLSAHDKATLGSKVGSYRVEEYQPTHLHWVGHYVRDIDDAAKKYGEAPIREGQGWLFDLLLRWTLSVDAYTPFLPGLPNKAVFDKWKFEVSDESATHVFLHGVPTDAGEKLYSSCDLCIKKDSLALEAVQYSMPGRRQNVFMFKEVELNPASHEMPDLSGYRCVSSLPKKHDASQQSPEENNEREPVGK